MSYSYHDLLKAYQRLGVDKGRVVYVVASLPYLREFEKPGASVLDAHYNALRSLLGKEGTIVVFTQSTQLCNTDVPYELDNTPSISGVFSEYIRKKKGAYRSCHPFCSFAAIGKRAKEIVLDTTRHAYGPETPMARMIDLNTLTVSIGLSPRWGANTIHHVEMVMGVPYRYTKEFVHPVVRNGKITKELFYLYVWYRQCDLRRDRLVKIFEKFGARYRINSVVVGKGQIYSYSMPVFYRCAVQLLKEDIYMWLKEGPQTRPYRK